MKKKKRGISCVEKREATALGVFISEFFYPTWWKISVKGGSTNFKLVNHISNEGIVLCIFEQGFCLLDSLIIHSLWPTPALKAHAEDKLGNALMKIFDRPALKIVIELSELGQFKDGQNMECRATVSMPHGKTINITEVADNMYKAVDLAHDSMLI